jgi:WD40 repeat protein
VQTLWSPPRGVSGLTFSPDGDMLAAVASDVVYCWTRGRNWEKSGLKFEPGQITAVAFHPTGRTLAYAALNTREIARAQFRTAFVPPEPEPGAPVALPAPAGARAAPWRGRDAAVPPDASGVRLHPPARRANCCPKSSRCRPAVWRCRPIGCAASRSPRTAARCSPQSWKPRSCGPPASC